MYYHIISLNLYTAIHSRVHSVACHLSSSQLQHLEANIPILFKMDTKENVSYTGTTTTSKYNKQPNKEGIATASLYPKTAHVSGQQSISHQHK